MITEIPNGLHNIKKKKKKIQGQKHGDTRWKEIQHSGTIPKLALALAG
jgi:hypothetical protein